MTLAIARLATAALTASLGTVAACVGRMRRVGLVLACTLTLALAYRNAPHYAPGAPTALRGLAFAIANCAVVLIAYTTVLVRSSMSSMLRAVWIGMLVASSVGEGLVARDIGIVPGQSVSDVGLAIFVVITLSLMSMRTRDRHTRVGAPLRRKRHVSAIYMLLTAMVVLTRFDDALPDPIADMLFVGVLQALVLAVTLSALVGSRIDPGPPTDPAAGRSDPGPPTDPEAGRSDPVTRPV